MEFFPRSTLSWDSNTIILESGSSIYCSYNDGGNWEIEPKELRYSKSFKTIYPLLTLQNNLGILEKTDKISNKSKILLTINNYYNRIAATRKIWCVAGWGFTIITKNNGDFWNFYSNSIEGNLICEIINDKYIFNGQYRYDIK